MKSKIVELIDDKQNIFLSGGAGVGKSTLTNEIIAHYKSEAKRVASLASTGMAATLIEGQTLHSFFDLGICSSMEELEKRGKSNLKKKSKKLISSMSLIIIDEISMVSSEVFDLIRFRLLQAEFSGSLMVVGDFLQLPPVVRGAALNFAFESESWTKFEFETILLTHIYRTSDQEFIELLNNVRFGTVFENEVTLLSSFIKPFGEDLSKFTFLFGKNISAQMHNKAQLEFIQNDKFLCLAEVVKHNTKLQDKDVSKFMVDSRVEESLELKVGAPVLFTKNSWNYFNGEKGTITKIADKEVFVLKADGSVVKIEQVAYDKTKWDEKKIDGKLETVEVKELSVFQYPIALAFAITIHKSQGMSIDNLIIETNEIFAPSQFYVAISRTINPVNLTLIAPKRSWQSLCFVNQKAFNYVSSLT
ncbi:MAG: AAA family ATPase [Helicobacteraceae bacterium]|nr:AAA family ATPase [Helicobacteraceae bacterium]